MWQAWFSGILGIWLILVVFLGFSSTLMKFFLILTGLALAFFGFWTFSLTKPFFKDSGKNSESEIMPPSPASPNRGEPAGGPPSQDQGEIIPSRNASHNDAGGPPEEGENEGENNA